MAVLTGFSFDLPDDRDPRVSVDFASGEHKILGDKDSLQGLPSNILNVGPAKLTYGEILALAGDFYGSPDGPICDGGDITGMMSRAQGLFDNIVEANQTQLNALLTLIREEADGINNKISQGKNPSEYYQELGSKHDLLAEGFTLGSYFNLAANNFDHFGQDAIKAYQACHANALAVASSKDPSRLNEAYTHNAIADHFLSDLFSAGHLRTQRRQFHSYSYVRITIGGIDISLGDYLAKAIHDEDSKYGLQVQNNDVPFGAHWACYGDTYYFDKYKTGTQYYCQDAISTSKQEIYTAFLGGPNAVPPPQNFAALKIIPDLKKAADLNLNQDHAPLLWFDSDNNLLCRNNVNKLSDHTYIKCLDAIAAKALLASYNL